MKRRDHTMHMKVVPIKKIKIKSKEGKGKM